MKALDLSKFRSDAALNPDSFGFNKIHKVLTSYKISQLQSNSIKYGIFLNELSNLYNKKQANDLCVRVVKFSSQKPDPFPSKSEIEILTDVAHNFSDITPIFIIDIQINNSNFS